MAVSVARAFVTLFAALVMATLGSESVAQADRSSEIEATRTEHSEIRAAIDAGAIKEAGATKKRLRMLREASRKRLASLERELKSVRTQLAPLGAPPDESGPPESANLAAQRGELNAALARLTSDVTRINANIFEANELLARISASQIQSHYGNLLARGVSPLAPAVWRGAGDSANAVWNRVIEYFEAWTDRRREAGRLAPAFGFMAIALGVSILLFGPADRWISATFAQAIEQRRATPPRRVLAAGLKMIARVAPGFAAVFLIIETLRAQGVLMPEGEPAARAMLHAIVVYLLVSGFLTGLFSPSNPSCCVGA